MSLNKIFKNYYLETIIILIIFFLDRISKLYVIHQDQLNFNSEIYSSKILNIILVWNEGIAFGLFSFYKGYAYNLLSLLIIFVILFMFFMLFKSKGIKKLSILFIIGGALGNLFDRLIYNSVPDFIDIHYQDFHWFVFNVADIFICLGVFLLIFLEFIVTDIKKNEN